MFWIVGTTGFRTASSIFTGKCKKEKDGKEKSDPGPILRTPNRAILQFFPPLKLPVADKPTRCDSEPRGTRFAFHVQFKTWSVPYLCIG